MKAIDRMWQDVRYGARALRRTPGVTAAAVITLALGIGATTTVYSLFEAVLLRYLPVASPDRLFFVAHGVDNMSTSSNYPWFERVVSQSDVFGGVAAYNDRDFKVATSDGVEVVPGQFVTGNYHAVLGVRFRLGRGFMTEDDRTASPIAVISDGYWARRFGRRLDVLQQSIVVGSHAVTIVGVTEPGFEGMQPGSTADITLPLSLRVATEPEFLAQTDTWTSMPIVVRLRDGVNAAEAESIIASVYRDHMSRPENREFSRTPGGRLREATLLPAGFGADSLRGQYERPLQILLAMVAVVLLIGCVNIANLLLTRAPARAREMAVRMSVGGGRGRLIGQLVIESLLLALCGGIIGVVLAFWGTEFVAMLFRTGTQPIVIDAEPDGSVLTFAIAVSLVTGIAFGLAPAWKTTGVDLAHTLNAGATPTTTGRRRLGQYSLVTAQIGLCLMLVFCATLLARSLSNLRSVDGGFETQSVVLFEIDANDTSFPHDRLEALCGDVIRRLGARADVRSGSCSTMSPIAGNSEGRPVSVPGYTPGPATPPFVYSNSIDQGYFATLGIPVLRGRGFDARDSATAERVAVLGETMARHYFGDTDPIGRSFRFGRSSSSPPITIVGVARDARHRLRLTPPPMAYVPLSQRAEPPRSLLAAVRTTGDTAGVVAAVPRELRALNRDVAISYVRTMREQIGAALVGERVLVTLSGSFAVLALVLACIGLYGVMSYDVARRARDIGIRLALGARRAHVLGQVMGTVCLVTLLGLIAGAGVALAASRTLTAFLFGLAANDSTTLLVSILALAVTALSAGYLPARKAARVDPATVLRME